MATTNLFDTVKKPLRDYQKRCVNEICSSDENLLVSLPTGAGKTVIAGNVMEQLHSKTVFIVPRIELIYQAVEEFGGDVDVIWLIKPTYKAVLSLLHQNNLCLVKRTQCQRTQRLSLTKRT